MIGLKTPKEADLCSKGRKPCAKNTRQKRRVIANADALIEDIASNRVNVGAAAVVPAKNILAMIDTEKIRTEEARLLQEIKDNELLTED